MSSVSGMVALVDLDEARWVSHYLANLEGVGASFVGVYGHMVGSTSNFPGTICPKPLDHLTEGWQSPRSIHAVILTNASLCFSIT